MVHTNVKYNSFPRLDQNTKVAYTVYRYFIKLIIITIMIIILIIITSIYIAHISKRTLMALYNKYKKLIKINFKMSTITVDIKINMLFDSF